MIITHGEPGDGPANLGDDVEVQRGDFLRGGDGPERGVPGPRPRLHLERGALGEGLRGRVDGEDADEVGAEVRDQHECARGVEEGLVRVRGRLAAAGGGARGWHEEGDVLRGVQGAGVVGVEGGEGAAAAVMRDGEGGIVRSEEGEVDGAGDGGVGGDGSGVAGGGKGEGGDGAIGGGVAFTEAVEDADVGVEGQPGRVGTAGVVSLESLREGMSRGGEG